MQATTFDVGELLDEANMLSLSASLEAAQTALLIGKLRTCANQAFEAEDGSSGQKLRDIANVLERRLLAT